MRFLELVCVFLGVWPLTVSYPVSSKHAISLYKDESWDHFIFMQQYPPGFCEGYSGSSCSYPRNASSWTIHGLWPTLGDTKGPNYCNRSAVFEINEIKDLIPKLTLDWTDLLNTTVFGSFWDHEWCKHGTCSGMPDEHTYFQTVLRLYEQDGWQFGNILQKQGIVPSDDQGYSVQDILNAFKSELGVFPYSVNCEKSILKQIGICLDKGTFKPINCPSKTDTYSCRTDSISYPTSIYSHH